MILFLFLLSMYVLYYIVYASSNWRHTVCWKQINKVNNSASAVNEFLFAWNLFFASTGN
jgi:hypothetical protein